jgi:cation diffusion facilitator CzcD-associated flavoprotein CzcO
MHFSVVEADLPHNLFSEKDTQPERMTQICNDFIARFRHAVETANAEEFDDLVVEGGYWRDLVSFTNDFRSFTKANILQAARDRLAVTGAYGGEMDFKPKFNVMDEHANIEFGFKFASSLGPCVSTVRLVKTETGEFGAFVLYTALDGIHGNPEQVRSNRISGDKNSMLPYDEIRRREMDAPQPSVIIVGAGHCGLSVAARLKYLGIKPLVIDRFERVGDNWRKRYGSLALHDTLYSQALPYMSWPETFPEFISAGKLANWLEHYAESMELNVWVKSHVVPEKTYFDEKGQKWHVTIDRDGQENAFVVDHIVLATGLCGKPKMPKPFPGQEKFIPDIIHSTQHKGGDGWKGKNVLVVGTGSSGHDISLDLCNHGANPTILQRSPTYVLSIKNGIVKTLNGDLMVEGVNLDYADRITEAMPKAVTKAVLQKLVPKIAELDKDLLQGLKKAGFQTYLGPDSSGSLFLSMERGGGFYFESGASQKIIDGGIKVKNGEIDHFTENSVVFKDGTNMEPDLVIFCTGYTGFKESVCETLGEEYGNQLSKIWGLDCEGEINGLYRDCGLPNTYFMSGALPINRPYSKLLALQIAAQKLGRLGPRYSIEQSRKSGNYVDLSGLLYQ